MVTQSVNGVLASFRSSNTPPSEKIVSSAASGRAGKKLSSRSKTLPVHAIALRKQAAHNSMSHGSATLLDGYLKHDDHCSAWSTA